MRSASEISFRLRQEIVNLRLAWLPTVSPRQPVDVPFPQFPEPSRVAHALARTSFAEEIRALSGAIHAHRFPLLGGELDTGPDIQWRRDYVNRKETGADYLRLVPYLDVERAGDHKNIWELNRHQHLIVLAQAYLLDGEAEHLAEIGRQLDSWWAQNPFQHGINWTSALEVAFRALSWLWVIHLAGRYLPETVTSQLLASLHQHGLHLENNLSFYFSPNTHLLGEAVVLHALGALLPSFRSAARWRTLGRNVVEEQMRRQVRDDGSHFEQSTYYHVYSTDMFLFHALLAEPSPEYREQLRRMAVFLDSLLGCDRRIPPIGDDDGGRWFHPYGDRGAFGRATIAACSRFFAEPAWRFDTADLWPIASWCLGHTEGSSGGDRQTSTLFSDAGLAVLNASGRQVIVDVGGFGPGRAGHSHADTLAIVARLGAEEVLIDPGTYTYVGDPRWRNWFRGTLAHNTVRIDSLDQASPVGPFWWDHQPQAAVSSWSTSDEKDLIEAECRYRGLVHRRRICFFKPDALLLVDEITGQSGEHLVEQCWHFGSEAAATRLVTESEPEPLEAFRSPVFGQMERGIARVVRKRGPLPVLLPAALALGDAMHLLIERQPGNVLFRWQRQGKPRFFSFPLPL